MSIDITTEKLISPAEYARMRPPGRNGRPMHLATAYRHIFVGVQGVLLEHVKMGGQTYTSVEAVQRFVERLTESRSGDKPAPTPVPAPSAAKARTASQSQRDADRAVREIDKEWSRARR